MKSIRLKLSGMLMLCLTLMLLAVCPAVAHAENITIQCGDNVYGTLDETGVLTISGSGNMWNCSSGSYFGSIRDSIYKVVIQDGVTSVGAYAFSNFDNLQSVSIGKGVKSIGAYAFHDTDGLFSINIPGNVQTICEDAFEESGLKNCTLHEGLREIEPYAFAGTCMNAIVIPDGVTAIRKHAFYYSGYGSLLKNVTIPANIKVIEESAFYDVSATIYSRTVTVVGGAFGSSSSFTAAKGSSADTYASNYDLTIYYFKCTPSTGLPALEHTFDTGKITKAPTCLAKGEKTFTCTLCGEKETQVLDLANHQWKTVPSVEKKATCDEDGVESIRCSVCNKVRSTAKIPAKGHTFSKWKVTIKPTVLKAGKQTRKCSVCGKKETESVARLKPGLKLNVSVLTIKVGQSSEKIKVVSKGSGDYVTSWSSTDPGVVTVNSRGKITGKAAGNARVRVKLKSGISKSVKVTVKRIAARSLKVTSEDAVIKKGRMTLKEGGEYSLTAKVSPQDCTDRVTYSSSDKSIVTVNSKGEVTAKKAGTAKITVKSGSKKVVLSVTVK